MVVRCFRANRHMSGSLEVKKMNEPMQLSDAEWKEIFELSFIRDSWGVDDDPEYTVDIWKEGVYEVKFHFMSGCPGYVGDLYVLIGDALVACPIVLVRRDGKLEQASLEHIEFGGGRNVPSLPPGHRPSSSRQRRHRPGRKSPCRVPPQAAATRSERQGQCCHSPTTLRIRARAMSNRWPS